MMTNSRESPTVAAIVLNWNGYEDTVDCVESLKTMGCDDLEIVIVDNGSTDGSGELLRERFPDDHVLLTGENSGFAAGNNHGVRFAGELDASYVWLLNNDVLVPSGDVLNRILQTAQGERVGIVTPQVRCYPETEDIWFDRGTINWTDLRRGHEELEASEADFVENDYVPLCSALIPMELFDEVGLLPEQYFLYAEDIDFCTKVREAGYRVLTDRRVEVYHHESSSSGGSARPIPSYYDVRNQFEIARTYSDKVSLPLFLARFTAFTAVLVVYRLLLRRPKAAKAVLKGYVDGWRGITGQGPYP